MDPRVLLDKARAAGLRLEALRGTLVVHGRGEPPEEFLARLQARKAEVLALLASPGPWGWSASVQVWTGPDGRLISGPLNERQ